MMRILNAIAVLFLLNAGCMTAEPAGEEATTSSTTTSGTTDSGSAGNHSEATSGSFRVLEKGSYGMAAQAADVSVTSPSAEVATSASEYLRLWRTHISDAQPPAVDFSKESVVFLLLGSRSSGGYGIDPQTVSFDNAKALVSVRMIKPGKGDMTTQAFTAPYAVLAVEKPDLNAVEWRDASGEIVVEHRQ